MRNFKFFKGFEDELNFLIEHREVAGEIRRLRAVWNHEMADDIELYHNIDAEAELSNILANQIAESIDNEIITELSRRINGGDNIRYLNRWLDIGDNNRA
jgi:hypothetical protein